MKNNYLYNWVVIVFMMLQMLAFTSCSDDDDKAYIQRIVGGQSLRCVHAGR